MKPESPKESPKTVGSPRRKDAENKPPIPTSAPQGRGGENQSSPSRAQNGSWNLRDLTGLREDVLEQVRAAAFVPAAAKAFLADQLAAFDPKAKLVRLDAHVQVLRTKDGETRMGTWSLTEL